MMDLLSMRLLFIPSRMFAQDSLLPGLGLVVASDRRSTADFFFLVGSSRRKQRESCDIAFVHNHRHRTRRRQRQPRTAPQMDGRSAVTDTPSLDDCVINIQRWVQEAHRNGGKDAAFDDGVTANSIDYADPSIIPENITIRSDGAFPSLIQDLE